MANIICILRVDLADVLIEKDDFYTVTVIIYVYQ